MESCIRRAKKKIEEWDMYVDSLKDLPKDELLKVLKRDMTNRLNERENVGAQVDELSKIDDNNLLNYLNNNNNVELKEGSSPLQNLIFTELVKLEAEKMTINNTKSTKSPSSSPSSFTCHGHGKRTARSSTVVDCCTIKDDTNNAHSIEPQASLSSSSSFSLPPIPVHDDFDDGPPREFMEEIEKLGGKEIKLIIKRVITTTDLDKNNGRLNMPLNKIVSDFLKEEEKNKLEKKEAIMVKLIEPNVEVSQISLRKWKVGSWAYVLTQQWKEVVARNDDMKANDVLYVWSFRFDVDFKLGIALVKRPY